MTATKVKNRLEEFIDETHNASFYFKTDKGEYGEHDRFLGIRSVSIRLVAKEYKDLSMSEIEKILSSKFNEHRLTGLIILVERFKISDKNEQKKIYDFYLENIEQVNNWNLIDLSAHYIVGAYLLDKKDRKILEKLAKSENVWHRRIAIISTFWFIKHNDFNDTIKIAKILVKDEHDLIHKAVGWMLREVGKRDLEVEEMFLKDNNYRAMPRTMLRYATERFEEIKRIKYLKGEI